MCVGTPSPTVQIATSRRTCHPRTLAATALTVAAISWSTAPRSGALAFAVTPDRERVSLASSLQPENDNNNNINHQPATVETKFNKKRRRTKHIVALDATLPPTPYAPPTTSRVTPNKHPSPETSNSRKRRLTGVAATGVPRTSSFPPLTADQFPYWQKEFSRKGLQPVLPHTLILGTHPSVTSLQQEQYYGHAVKYVVSYHFLSVAHITFLIQPEPTLSRMDRTISSFLSHSFLYFYLLAGFFPWDRQNILLSTKVPFGGLLGIVSAFEGHRGYPQLPNNHTPWLSTSATTNPIYWNIKPSWSGSSPEDLSCGMLSALVNAKGRWTKIYSKRFPMICKPFARSILPFDGSSWPMAAPRPHFFVGISIRG